MTPSRIIQAGVLGLALVTSPMPLSGGTQTHATLPAHRYQHSIQDMSIGEVAWTMPWAMWVEEDGRLWLNGGYPAHQHPGGTVSLQMTRTTAGYTVNLSQVKDFEWKPSLGWTNPIPVIGIKD